MPETALGNSEPSPWKHPVSTAETDLSSTTGESTIRISPLWGILNAFAIPLAANSKSRLPTSPAAAWNTMTLFCIFLLFRYCPLFFLLRSSLPKASDRQPLNAIHSKAQDSAATAR